LADAPVQNTQPTDGGSTPVKPKGKGRRYELDLLRGIALMVMVFGHNVRVGEVGASVVLQGFGHHFAALFMIISGINVRNFYNKAITIPGFRATHFYVKASLFLFFMGFTYNMIIGTVNRVEIIQCMALGMLVAYLMLWAKVPNWLVGIITVLIFLTGTMAYSNGLILDPNVDRNFLWNYLICNGTVTLESSRSIPTPAYLHHMFGPIPWLGYFTFGLFMDRLKGAWRWLMGFACTGMAVAALWLPKFPAEGERVMASFQTSPHYVFQSLGLFGVWLLLFPLIYNSKTKLGKFLEAWSVQSLNILMFHWFYIYVLTLVGWIVLFATNDSVPMDVIRWGRAVVVFIILLLTIRPIAERQMRWMKHPKFESRLKAALWTGIALYAVGSIQLAGNMPMGVVWRFSGAFLAGWAFCFLYPFLRMKWRKECMPS
jgi:uncharacterized membrane protein